MLKTDVFICFWYLSLMFPTFDETIVAVGLSWSEPIHKVRE